MTKLDEDLAKWVEDDCGSKAQSLLESAWVDAEE